MLEANLPFFPERSIKIWLFNGLEKAGASIEYWAFISIQSPATQYSIGLQKKMQEHDARFSLTLNDLSMDLIDMSIALYAVSYQITSIFNQAPLTTQ